MYINIFDLPVGSTWPGDEKSTNCALMLIELNPVPEIVSVVALDIKGDVLEVTTSGTTVATVTFVTIAATPLAVIVARSNPALALTRFVS